MFLLYSSNEAKDTESKTRKICCAATKNSFKPFFKVPFSSIFCNWVDGAMVNVDSGKKQ